MILKLGRVLVILIKGLYTKSLIQYLEKPVQLGLISPQGEMYDLIMVLTLKILVLQIGGTHYCLLIHLMLYPVLVVVQLLFLPSMHLTQDMLFILVGQVDPSPAT